MRVFLLKYLNMAKWIRSRNAIPMHFQDLCCRVVAKSGIATDRYHLGKLIFQGFQDAPDFLLQIDGATDETETFGSALRRSVQCATAFRKLGIRKGDVVLLMAPHHIHLCIPIYATFYTGGIVAGIDMNLKIHELNHNFSINKPRFIFCQNDRVPDICVALKGLDFKTTIVTFDEGDKYLSFSKLLTKYGGVPSIEDFKVTDLDPTDTLALLIATSGTTGLFKSAAVTHANFAISAITTWSFFDKAPSPTRLSFIMSPLQWFSALFQYVFSPIVRNSRLQSSLPMTKEHAYYLINKYKPTFAMSSPNMWMSLFKVDDRDNCDFSCFELLQAGGSAVTATLIDVVKSVTPNTYLIPVFGLSEISGHAFIYDSTNPKSVGRPALCHEIRLVSPDTQKDVTEPNVPGELWIKGPAVFKGYFNDPEVTKNSFSADGWFKTGDLFKRDEQWYFYFVERIKMLLIYDNHQIAPVEIENVIIQHPAVFEVAVTAVPHPKDGDLPVACIVLHKNATVTAQEIKNIVKESLSDCKQLRGGVIFLKELPMTSSSKVNRVQLAILARTLERL